MSVIRTESNLLKIDILEEIQILTAAKSLGRLNDFISGNNEPFYRLSSVDII